MSFFPMTSKRFVVHICIVDDLLYCSNRRESAQDEFPKMLLKNARFSSFFFQKRYLNVAKNLEWPSNIVRRTFLDFYQNLGCKFVPSAPVLFKQDPSLIFVNAGMCQFKPLFLNSDDQVLPESFKSLKLAVNSQKCIRASGKHCDFETIGKNGKHHTFFEMLGNWAFNGEISKVEACEQAWRLMTEIYGLEKDRFFVTYFGGCEEQNLNPDFETREIWLKKIGLPEDRVIGLGLEDNFWEMGRSGPCGPCTEIFYSPPNEQNPTLHQCTEVWNLVFIQFDRQAEDGKLRHLPKMHLDTGMGLERICAVLQGVTTNYETDLFDPLVSQIENLSNHHFRPLNFDPRSRDVSLRILADHCRSCAVLLADDVKPSGKGAGHILRRLIRNAVYHARENLGCPPKTLKHLAHTFLQMMEKPFPEMSIRKNEILATLDVEEENFVKNVDKAKLLFENILQTRSKALSTKDLFSMYRNNGLPKEIIESMCDKYSVTFDDEQFEYERRCHIERSKSDRVKGRMLRIPY